VSGDVLTGRLPVSRHLQDLLMEFTPEQLAAIERRSGSLLLDASAGSGKTSVLVERFVRAVIEDGVEVSAILTITFTEKAAAELRDRIRGRLRGLGRLEAARATEGAFISTIHGFCARILRTHALAAGIDPAFAVLDQPEAEQLADAAFDTVLEDLAQNDPGGIDLVAAYGSGPLREATVGVFRELRARGALHPVLPPLPPLAPGTDLDLLRDELEQSAQAAAAELGAISDPAVRVIEALDRLERRTEVIGLPDPWPGELDRVALPGGNGAALSTPVCLAYAEALRRFREACEHRRAEEAQRMLQRLLLGFDAEYTQRKRACSGLDFEDLELLAREMLAGNAELRGRYRERFTHVMVDELQDTNVVQLELIESVADGNLFTVGDAQQSIYGFRHADVELFERLGERLAAVGARATLDINFRSRPEILAALNVAFAEVLAERFRPLRPGRDVPVVDETVAAAPVVELLVADKGADWTRDGLAAPWRLAEAAALARRVRELIDTGAAPREIVVLTRATTDLRAYERALEDLGVPTYVIGGRGYWAHPQVVDLVAYLRALANPRDEEQLLIVLASPLVGVSVDGLVGLMAGARAAARDPWWVLREPEGRLDGIGAADRDRLAAFAQWFAAERAAAPRTGVEELVERVLEVTGYDLAMLAMPGGQRRLANVRKLMRLGREHEAAAGLDLRGFLELVRARSAGWGGSGDSRESEAPVEGEALDAVRLMTIHRAKGLEFEIVCVADLGRGPIRRAPLIRVGRDGRLGLRLAEPGTGKREAALAYNQLGEEEQRLEQEEERRLFYVAMTRARERLILSGAAKFETWPTNGGSPMAWIGPAFIPDIASRVNEGPSVSDSGVRLTVVVPGDEVPAPAGSSALAAAEPAVAFPASAQLLPDSGNFRAPTAVPAPERALPVSRLSYSALGEYRRCGYRFYAERVLGLPPAPARGSGPGEGLTGTERGILVHAVLERLDFRRPAPVPVSTLVGPGERAPDDAEARELDALIAGFAASELATRLGRADDLRREERFAFLLADGMLMTGAFDVLARESPGRMLVVDYKSDRLQGTAPAAALSGSYATQRLVYALAAIRAGAAEVEVAHVFLEAPEEPVVARFQAAQADSLGAELDGLISGVVGRRFEVTEAPQRSICTGCPAEGGLCSWPLDMTRRESVDRLF
jgi:ATP-dependent exoDNAse (exonuclease V) beta subunit